MHKPERTHQLETDDQQGGNVAVAEAPHAAEQAPDPDRQPQIGDTVHFVSEGMVNGRHVRYSEPATVVEVGPDTIKLRIDREDLVRCRPWNRKLMRTTDKMDTYVFFNEEDQYEPPTKAPVIGQEVGVWGNRETTGSACHANNTFHFGLRTARVVEVDPSDEERGVTVPAITVSFPDPAEYRAQRGRKHGHWDWEPVEEQDVR